LSRTRSAFRAISTRSSAIAEKHDLWLLEDGCDALGSTWDGKLVGTFGAMSSISFYPAHHMTLGEGGMVVVNQGGVRKTCLSCATGAATAGASRA
jgi:dTDP-4-amino-4,6-dideoxygalactose transaminase